MWKIPQKYLYIIYQYVKNIWQLKYVNKIKARTYINYKRNASKIYSVTICLQVHVLNHQCTQAILLFNLYSLWLVMSNTNTWVIPPLCIMWISSFNLRYHCVVLRQISQHNVRRVRTWNLEIKLMQKLFSFLITFCLDNL